MDRDVSLGLQTAFDHLTALLCSQFGVPFALVSFVHHDLTVFLSETGSEERSRPREGSVSDMLVGMGPGAYLAVEDAQVHPILKDHPMVVGEPFLRFFAGVTISNGTGEPVGALGVMDSKPRAALTPSELQSLHHLAAVAGSMLEQLSAQRIQEERLVLLNLAEQMAGVGHWRYDVLSGQITWSDEVYRIHGFQPGEMDPSYQNALAFYHPDDVPVLEGLVNRAIANGEGYEFRLRLQTPGRGERLVDASATTEQDETGRTVALFGVFQDVTDRHAADQRLRESEERFRLLAANATDIVTACGLDGRFRYVSPAVKTVTGYTEDEVVGMLALDFVHPEDRERVEQEIGLALRSPGVTQIEHRHVRKDGTVIWVQSRPRLAFDPVTGKPSSVTDVMRDVTAQKALEADLIAARATAEEASRIKSDFVANMSHEIRTPLTAILGFTSLLTDRDDIPEDARVHLGRIAGAGQSLLSIVNDVLDFSKLEAGQYELRAEACDPLEVCHEALLMFAPLAHEKGIALDFEQSGDFPARTELDPHRLRQILLNLVGNAIKFTDAGSVRLIVSYDAARDALAVSVRDTGPGMDEGQCSGLFQRFSQVDTSTTRRHGGTGLGLAISKGLSEAMGGRIWVTSCPGFGSTFSFTVSAPAAMESPSPVAAASDEVLDLDGLRLLVVDDNPSNREIVSTLVGRLGVEVFEAASGPEAISMTGELPFDVILMDVRMPEMTGEEAARAIRNQSGPNQFVPILGFSADIHIDKDGLNDFDGLVAKPIVLAELFGAIASSLRISRDPASIAASVTA